MTALTTTVFDLPDRLAAKADPALIAGDEQHFAAIAESLEQSIADLTDRLDAARRAPGGTGQEAMDRDLEVHRLTARLRTLRRFGLDLCLGHMVTRGRPRARVRRPARPHRQRGSPAAGRLALPRGRAVLRRDPRQPDGAGEPPPVPLDPRPDHRLLGRGVHRRRARGARRASTTSPRSSPASAAAGRPGCATCSAPSRPTRTPSSAPGRAARSSSTAGRAPARPSSRCTATAYLLYSDPRLGHRRGGVLFVGPHQPYLAYVADVLPSLGEEGVQTCTLRDLVPEGATAALETDPEVARLKASADHGEGDRAGRPALRGAAHRRRWTVETPWADLWLGAADWAEAFDAPDPGTPHNEARDQVWEELVDDPGRQARTTRTSPETQLRRSLLRNRGTGRRPFNRAWPLIEPTDLVGDLWSVPAYLRRCAPWLEPDEVRPLQRADAAGLDRVRPAAARRGPAAARRPGGVPAPTPSGRRRRRRPARADGAGRRRPDRDRRLRDGAG